MQGTLFLPGREWSKPLRAELTLRGLEPPWDIACHALEEISVKPSKLFESLDRGKLMEIEERLVTDLSAYLHSRDCPQN
jgi:hypothetical protein